MIDVRSSARFICQNLKSLSIDSARISEVANKIAGNEYALPEPEDAMPFKGRNLSESAMWCYLADCLNFCFWPPVGKDKWQVQAPDGKWRGGYFGLIQALKKGIDQNRSWLDPIFLRAVKLEDVSRLLAGKGELQLLEERKIAINELGLGLKDQGSALNFIEEAKNNVIQFVDSMIKKLPSFKDESELNGRKVGFYKRAQILAMDLNLVLSQHGITPFNNIERLTAFADYKLPQLFRDEGIFKYCDELKSKIDAGGLIEKDSKEEIEIRGATIFAVESLRNALFHLGISLSSPALDNILWTEAKSRTNMQMHHLTKTIFY